MKRTVNLNSLVVQLHAKAAEVRNPDESILWQDAASKLIELAEALRGTQGELERVTELRNKFSERLSLMLARVDELEKENGKMSDQLQAIDDAGICLPESVASGRGDDDDEVEQPLPESIGDDGGIFVYGVNGLGEPVVTGKPPISLGVERKVIFECGSHDLDAFLSELIGHSFEFEAYEELGDGDIRSFDVKPEAMSEDDQRDAQRGDLHYKTGELLNHACARGYIAPGEYVVYNRM